MVNAPVQCKQSSAEWTRFKDRILADAIAAVVGRVDADADQLGLIGFSLGATTAMTFHDGDDIRRRESARDGQSPEQYENY